MNIDCQASQIEEEPVSYLEVRIKYLLEVSVAHVTVELQISLASPLNHHMTELNNELLC